MFRLSVCRESHQQLLSFIMTAAILLSRKSRHMAQHIPRLSCLLFIIPTFLSPSS